MKIFGNFSVNCETANMKTFSSCVKLDEKISFLQKSNDTDIFTSSNSIKANKRINQIKFKGANRIVSKLEEKCDSFISSDISDSLKESFRKITDILIKYVETDKLDKESLHLACTSYMSEVKNRSEVLLPFSQMLIAGVDRKTMVVQFDLTNLYFKNNSIKINRNV